MKFTILAVTFFLWTGSFANADELPGYPATMNGTALIDLFKKATFNFTGSTPEKCSRREVGQLIFYDCRIDGSKATLGLDTASQSFKFHRVKAILSSTKKGPRYEYSFFGNWSDANTPKLRSSVLLIVHYMKNNPDHIVGEIKLRDYGHSTPIEAGLGDSETGRE